MVLVVLRHSDDDQPSRYEHDHAITPRGVLLARATAKHLIAEYGMPSIIYTSAFRRTRETLNAIRPVLKGNVQTVIDNDASRFFNSSEQRKPGVHPSTMEHKPPIVESWEDFQARCRRHFAKALEQSKTQVVWTISHYLVYRTIAEDYSIELPKHTPFCDFMVVENGKAKDCRQIRTDKIKQAKLRALEKNNKRRTPATTKMDTKDKRKLDKRPTAHKDKEKGKGKEKGTTDTKTKGKGWENGIYKDSRHFQVEKKGDQKKPASKKVETKHITKKVDEVIKPPMEKDPVVEKKPDPVVTVKSNRIVLGPTLLSLND